MLYFTQKGGIAYASHKPSEPDNYEKIVIAMECDLPQDQDGIKIVRAVDFLLDK